MPQFQFAAHDRHSPVPVAERTQAHLVITPELLAATAPATLSVARSYHRIWFGGLAALCDHKLVTVFDDFVIGPPDPLTLEVAARLLRFHEADHDGEFDDENYEANRQWELEHEDDLDDEDFDGVAPEPPTMVERTIESMRQGQEFERIELWEHLYHAMVSPLTAGSEQLVETIRLSTRAEALLVDVAPFVRLNSGIVIDARLDESRRPYRRWAA